MNSSITKSFRDALGSLPEAVRDHAARAFALWKAEPYHPSLQFKRVSQRRPIYSVRIGLGYRAIGDVEDNHVRWFWIGTHAEYDGFLQRL